MKLISYAQKAGLALCAFTLSACSLAPIYARPDAPVPLTLAAGDASGARMDDAGAYDSGWREFFTDPRLQALLDLGLRHNRDLKMATLAVREAGAKYGVQNAERFPQLEAQGSRTDSGKFEERSATRYEVTAMASFELDFFGRLRNMSAAALESYLATAEAEKNVRISLVSQVAQSYLAECLARERLALARDTLDSRRRSYAFIETRVQSGQSSLLDLEQARSMVESASAALAQLEREELQATNALRLLLGSHDQTPLPEATPLAEQRLPELPDGVASSILLRRPDVMEAEHGLRAANADIGAARAAFFPSISLTGELGYMSDSLSTLISGASGFWSFLPRISLPLFTGGRNRANLELAELRKERSVAAYEKTIQNAFREVADTLHSRASFSNQFAAQTRYLASQRLVLELAMNRYANGAVSYLEVLDAQRGVFQAEQDLLGIRRDQLVNDIRLYSALGGGLSESGPSEQASPVL